MPTILYFHGNAGEIGDRPLRFNYYHSRGFGVAYLSYRGYGGSSGSPSEAGLITDATAAYDWLIAKGVEPSRIAVLGESLGSGVAVQLAAKREVGAVALEAPYTSTVDVAANIYWWLPVHALMKDQFKSMDFISAVVAPLLIIHGDQDDLDSRWNSASVCLPPPTSRRNWKLSRALAMRCCLRKRHGRGKLSFLQE